MYHIIIILIILSTAITGTITYKKFKNSKLKYFLYFLWYVLISELLAYFLKEQGYYTNPIYNIYSVISFTFYFNLFYKIIVNDSKKKIIEKFMVVFLAFAIINKLFIQNSAWSFQSNTIFFGTILLVPTIIMFYMEVLNKEVLFKINKVLIFWISIGLLLFYVGFFPVFVARKFFNFEGSFFQSILIGLNIIMYGSFIIGFIKTQKQYNE